MQAVTIHELRPLGDGQVLAVDLIDILRLCEPGTLASSWRIRSVDCEGNLAGEFMRLGDAGAVVSGAELLRLAGGVHQVIWGDFEAYRPGEQRWWLVVRAIDSSFYVVITEDTRLLHRVRSQFADVRPSPGTLHLIPRASNNTGTVQSPVPRSVSNAVTTSAFSPAS